jgi:multiple sugar transport system ATP-binding protein
MSRVVLEGVTKKFGAVVAVDDLSIDVDDREFLVLLGPSGCGKSTVLRMIAGLEDLTSGTITIGDRVVNDVPPKERDIAMVFQSYALYPHMTVAENIGFHLKITKVPKAEREQRVREAARILELADLLDRKPGQLSGGQRQRVALARAIVRRPLAFLMDEPLSNLDAKLRVQTRAELIELQRRLEATVIYVTHDQVEAMTMGHRIAIMNDGRLQQLGPPQDVYAKPANLFVAQFIGTPPMNTVRGPVQRDGDWCSILLSGGRVPLPDALAKAVAASGLSEVVVGVRPEHLLLAADGPLKAQVTVVEALGHERHVVCRLEDGQMIIVRQPSSDAAPRETEPIALAADPVDLHVFDAETEARIEP